ncbi:5' nucleotidase, NT5C type [Pseudothermotoga thermarum]|nr:hypothetical protein [Pseudothermotoga thermarum]
MIDVDDVLTNFNRAFLEIANRLFSTPIDVEITVWEFHKCVPGLDLEKEMKVWEEIENTEDFYEKLPLYASQEDIQILKDVVNKKLAEVYLITARFPVKGKSVEEQTKNWVKKHIGLDLPVIVTSSKGKKCQKLGISIALDDAPHHIKDLIDHGIPTVVMDWPYNRYLNGLPRVRSLKEFLEKYLFSG